MDWKTARPKLPIGLSGTLAPSGPSRRTMKPPMRLSRCGSVSQVICLPPAAVLKGRQGAEPRAALLLLFAGVAHHRDGISRGRYVRLRKLGLGAAHRRRSRPQPGGDHTVGMEVDHDIGPDPAAGMAPKNPG